MKLNLPNVTLLGLDCLNVERLQVAMDICQKDIEFGAVKLLSSLPTDDTRLVRVPHITSAEEYSKFCFTELKNYVDTDYVLIVQYDGFILNPQSWTDEFLNYDYIGAPFHVRDWFVKRFNFPESLLGTLAVGNGGFSLRSKKFLETSAKLVAENKITNLHPEDISLCVWHKDLLDVEGIKIAPPELGLKFSIEGEEEVFDRQFGFHGMPWTNIDTWINQHPEYPIVVDAYKRMREEHFERERQRKMAAEKAV